jgi:spore coat protein U-like protein
MFQFAAPSQPLLASRSGQARQRFGECLVGKCNRVRRSELRCSCHRRRVNHGFARSNLGNLQPSAIWPKYFVKSMRRGRCDMSNRWLCAAVATTLMASTCAQANVSGTMGVQLQLENGCIVSDSNEPLSAVDFGTMDFGVAPTLFEQNLYAEAMISGSTVQLECSAGASLNILVGNGQNAAGGVRRMASGGNFVEYRLFTQPNGGGVEYAVGGGALDLSALVPGVGGTFDLPIYGVVAPQSGLVAGSYSDLVSITLTF